MHTNIELECAVATGRRCYAPVQSGDGADRNNEMPDEGRPADAGGLATPQASVSTTHRQTGAE